MRSLVHALPLALFLLACSSDGGQFGEETFECAVLESRDVAWDGGTPLGTAAAVRDRIEGAESLPVAWADDATATATVTVTDVAQPRFVVYEACGDALVVSASVTVATDDGRLEEALDLELRSFVAGQVLLFERLETLEGSLDVDAFAPADAGDDIFVDLDLVFDPEATHGRLDGSASSTDGEVASVQRFSIATFGSPPSTP